VIYTCTNVCCKKCYIVGQKQFFLSIVHRWNQVKLGFCYPVSILLVVYFYNSYEYFSKLRTEAIIINVLSLQFINFLNELESLSPFHPWLMFVGQPHTWQYAVLDLSSLSPSFARLPTTWGQGAYTRWYQRKVASIG
jgi:hypothetical protein